MFPLLIDLGERTLPLLGRTHLFLPTYGVLFAAGTLLAWWWFMRRGRALGVEEERLFNLTFYALLGGIVGAKLTLILLDWRDYVRDPAALLGTLRSAGVLMGGVLVGALVFTVYARRNDLPLFRLGDAIAAPLALAQGLGRLGCFAAGCCWGREAAPGSWLAVTFTDPMAARQTGVPLDVALVPTQLLQAANDLMLAALLTWLYRRNFRPAGSVFWIYVVLYGLGRGLIEFWRGDGHRGVYFDNLVSTSQILSAAAILFALAMLWLRRPKDAPHDPQAESPRRA